MSTAPTECPYCHGTDPACGFCETGKPLDTQADWDETWGPIFDWMEHASTGPGAGMFR